MKNYFDYLDAQCPHVTAGIRRIKRQDCATCRVDIIREARTEGALIERRACANIADNHCDGDGDTANRIADAIRSRGGVDAGPARP